MVDRQIPSKPKTHIVGIEPGISRTEVRVLTTELRRLKPTLTEFKIKMKI